MLVDNCEGFRLARGPLGFRGYWLLAMTAGVARRQGYCAGGLVAELPP
jgi:hypothetical protein